MPLTYELIEKLEREIPGYNKRPLNLCDFETLCGRKGIVAFEHKMPARGWYFIKGDQPFIVINSGLSKGHQAFVGFHEYFHHRYHPGGHHFYKRLGITNRVEMQASTMAAIAIIPTQILKEDLLIHESLQEKYDIPQYLADFRLRVYRMYRQLRMFRDV